MFKSTLILAVIALFFSSVLFSCGKDVTMKKDTIEPNPKTENKIPGDNDERIPWKTSTGDEIEYTILPPGKNMQHIFGDTYTELELTSEEIEYAFRKIDTCFWDQRRGTVNRLLDMKPADYKMQFICAKNSKGEKMLWINGFCKNKSDIYTNWKDNLIEVDDGGKCYWNLRLNLDNRGEHYVLRVNGHS